MNYSNQHCCGMVKSDHVLSCKNFATALSTVMYNQCSIVWYYSSIVQQIHIPNIRFTYSLPNQELELQALARKQARHSLIRNYSIVCSSINLMHNFSNQIPIAETNSIFPLKVYPATHLDRILFIGVKSRKAVKWLCAPSMQLAWYYHFAVLYV